MVVSKDDSSALEIVIRKAKDNNSSNDTLLSEYFPRRMAIIYNRFHENLLIKRDMTSNQIFR